MSCNTGVAHGSLGLKPFYIEMTRFPLITEGRDEAMHTPNRL